MAGEQRVEASLVLPAIFVQRDLVVELGLVELQPGLFLLEHHRDVEARLETRVVARRLAQETRAGGDVLGVVDERELASELLHELHLVWWQVADEVFVGLGLGQPTKTRSM